MAKAKRMSDIFASSAEKGVNVTNTSATPPYSSEGPTLPILDGEGENKVNSLERKPGATASNEKGNIATTMNSAKQAQPIARNHPALYEPWTLLPREVLGLLISQARLADTQNVVPVVFTKNQNIKGGIVRLTTYLGAQVNKKNPMDLPEALNKKEAIIAVSAQGEGTTKLVSIVDMVKNIAMPKTTYTDGDGTIETWWMYTSLASVEVEQKSQTASINSAQVKAVEMTQETQEEEAFEPVELDVPDQKKEQTSKKMLKVPVLTVWMTKKRIPAFKDAFGEQTFVVQTLPKEE